MVEKICQSCGMRMQDSNQYGTNSDGSKNDEYCCYCYQNGAFTKEETIEEMIETCVPFMVQSGLSEEQARAMLISELPTLKRWIHILKDKAVKLCEQCGEISVASISQSGYPYVSILSKIASDGYRTVYFATGTTSEKVNNFKSNSKASVCYYQNFNSVTLTGDIEIINDMEIKKQMWQGWFIEHFPKGVEDENYCLVKFVGTKAKVWIDRAFTETNV